MNKYKSYAQIDLPWIKRIPSHWKINKVKRYSISKKEINKGNKEKNVLSLTYKGVIKNNLDNPNGLVPKSYETYQKFKKNDLAFKLIDLENIKTSRVGIVHEDGIMSPAYIRLEMNENFFTKYAYYYFYKLYVEEVYNNLGAGVRSTMTVSDLQDILIPIPSYSEQQQIVNYLDWKIREIDNLIQIEKKKIEELEMYKLKELNNIYKNIVTYKEIPLKRVGKIFPGKEIEDETKEGIPVYGSGKNIFKYTTKELLNGEYIIFGRKGTIGKPYKLSGKFWIVDTAYAIKNNDLVLLDYLYYLLRIFNWEDFLTNTVKPSIVANQILQVKMRIPSIEIQEKIVKNIYLLEEKIKNTIKLSNKKISLLIELKNSLISEVVTGQIDVRNAKIPERK